MDPGTHAVVVGGGIVGLSTAHALADRGVAVTVCEAGSPCGGNTGRAVGGIRAQFSTPVNVALSRASIPVWERFEAEFGVDIDYRRTGYLLLARSAETARAFREQVRMQREHGVPSEYLEPGAAAAHCPGLRTDRFVGASYCRTDGVADPHLACQGYATAVREAGVDVRAKTPVTGLAPRSDGLSSTGAPGWTVETPGGPIETDWVVLAAGAWTRRVAALAGVDLPIAPRRRQVAVVEPSRPLPADAPLTIDLDAGAYFRPDQPAAADRDAAADRPGTGDRTGTAGGTGTPGPAATALVGGQFARGDADPDVDPDRFDGSMDLAWAAEAVERVAAVTDRFGPETRLRRGWAGCYAVTPDHHPIVDEVRPGLVVAAGFSGHGFQHAPATGRVVAELVRDGAASTVDVSRLRLDRFDDDGTDAERNVA